MPCVPRPRTHSFRRPPPSLSCLRCFSFALAEDILQGKCTETTEDWYLHEIYPGLKNETKSIQLLYRHQMQSGLVNEILPKVSKSVLVGACGKKVC